MWKMLNKPAHQDSICESFTLQSEGNSCLKIIIQDKSAVPKVVSLEVVKEIEKQFSLTLIQE